MTIRVDWLAFTVRDIAPDAVQERLLGWVPGDFVELEYGSYSYARQAVGPGLARTRWSDDRADIHVELPGKWLGAVPADKVLEVLSWVSDKAWYVAEREDGTSQPRLAVTRLDLAADDFAKIVTPADVEAERRGGNIATHAKSGSFTTDWATKGETFALGKRGSRQYLRVYDKAAESGGEIDAIRWELQFRDEAAASALERLVYEELVAGTVTATEDGWHVEGTVAGDSARDLNRMLLSALRRVERRTRLRATWTSGDTTERFFDYVPKGSHRTR